MIIELSIKEEYIRLDSALKLAGFVMTGGQAKIEIQEGNVSVNGERCLMRGKKLRKGDKASIGEDTLVIKNAG